MVTLNISLKIQAVFVGVVALSDQDQHDGTTPTLSLNLHQGIVYLDRNGNFFKGTQIWKIIVRAKVDARAVLLKKKVHWFFSYACNRKFTAFECFAAG